MKRSIEDRAMDILHQRAGTVKDKLSKQYKNVRPFRMEPVPDETHINIYDNMTSQDLEYAVQTYGEESVNDWMFRVNQLKSKRMGGM